MNFGDSARCECKEADQILEHILTVEDTERPNLAQWSYIAGKLWGSAEELKSTAKLIGDIRSRSAVECKEEGEKDSSC
jgi:hypothetical protein